MIRTSFIYVAVLALMLIGLSVRVIRGRFRNQVSLGDGGNPQLKSAIRTHANFTEYVPMALILLVGIELFGYSANIIHALGSLLIFGRISHVIGMAGKNSVGKLRPIGMMATFFMLAISSILILARIYSGL